MTKPERQPDFILGFWHFYFTEMIQLNKRENKLYFLEAREDHIVFYDEKWDRWKRYDHYDLGSENDSANIFKAYVDWQLENILLD
jgi:hypothetical protein